jgi:hypothetical protein
MKTDVGEYYGQAKSTTVTTVDHWNGGITIAENEWDDVWQVTHVPPSTKGIESTEELRRTFFQFMNEMAAVESLGYEVVRCDEDVIFWEREK